MLDVDALPRVRHLTRARDLADSRYAEGLAVADLAAALPVPAHFSREFRRAFGESPYSYLLTRRLERAASLLRSTDYSVADICMRVGLTSVGSFTSRFTRGYAMSPPPTAPRSRRRPTSPTSRRACCGPTDDRRTARSEKTPATALRRFVARDPRTSEDTMIQIGTAQLWVHDQDEALEFWTTKVGFEVREDVTVPEIGNFRWLTVGPRDQEGIDIVLMAIPGPPVMDEATRVEVAKLMAKGFAGTVFLTTDDCMKAYEEFSGRGVEFTEAPDDRPYGIDCGFRDPSGNSVRLSQRRAMS